MTTPPPGDRAAAATPPPEAEQDQQPAATARSATSSGCHPGEHRHGHGARAGDRHRPRRAADRVHQRRPCCTRGATSSPRPGTRSAQAWDVAFGTYWALFEGSVFNPHTVAALFQQASLSTAIHDGYLSAVFNPLSETAVQATPLILDRPRGRAAVPAGLFNIGGQSQFIGGAIMAAWLGYAYNMPFFVHVVVCVRRRVRRRRGARLAGGRDQGAHRGARGDRHDHAQLRHAVLPGLPAVLAVADGGARRRPTRSPCRSRRTPTCRCWPAPTCASTPAS